VFINPRWKRWEGVEATSNNACVDGLHLALVLRPCIIFYVCGWSGKAWVAPQKGWYGFRLVAVGCGGSW
jgi:hypothetical protein